MRDQLVEASVFGRRRRHDMDLFYSQFVRRDDTCFDIGANIGTRVAVFRRLGGRVVAVEPQAVCWRRLQDRFRSDPGVVVVPKALGSEAGTAELMVSQAHTLSSLSREWMHAVSVSGRFAGYSWEKTETVEMTTLDGLISEYGLPNYCKIDVEGFESRVLAGLSQPVPAVSFEFAAEMLDNATACIDRLQTLGDYEFNYDVDEGMNLQLPAWVPADEMKSVLAALPGNRAFGDVYARLRSESR